MPIYDCNLNYRPNFSNRPFPSSKVKYYNNDRIGLIRAMPTNYNAQTFLLPNNPIISQRNVLPPKLVRRHNFIGVEVVGPNAYMRQHESELINSSQMPNLEITKWFNSNKKLPQCLPYNARLVSKNSQPFNTRLRACLGPTNWPYWYTNRYS